MDYQKQKQLLAEKVFDIIVATPGRLLDFKRQGDVHLGKVEILVLDEADHMLDMGFIPDVRQIIHSTPPKERRQTMLFGATLTPEVSRLASQWTREPFTVEIEPEQVAVDTVDQVVYLTTAKEKFTVLYNLIKQQKPERIIIFCNRRDQTRRLAERLRSYRIRCAFLSGEIGQKKRIRTLEDFRAGKIRVMVATDVAGRGIHVEGISHVVNYNLPLDPEDYVHRIGRTGRAGVAGTSISFATEDESFQLPAISEFIGYELPCVYPEDPLLSPPPPPPKGSKPSPSGYDRSKKNQHRPKRRRSSRRQPRKKPQGRSANR
jgi:ATP-dependent RNA helicase RhlB